jgi:ESCRT-II complex subunit VPS22
MPPVRLPGRAGIQRAKIAKENAAVLGDALHAELVAKMERQIAEFTEELTRFARHHEADIQSNPVFRAKFHEMCNKLGVDPLNSRKGVWAKLLPTMGDFYYVLGTRIVEICLATRPMNGGLIGVPELLRKLQRHQDSSMESVSGDDVEQAVRSLATLGSGFQIVTAGTLRLVRSVPVELNEDHTTVLNLCRDTGCVTVATIQKHLGWDNRRATETVAFLMEKGLAWVDISRGVSTYWVLGLVQEAKPERR